MIRNPNKKTVRKVIDFLNSQGLFVYGVCMDLDTGYSEGSNMDYDAAAVEKYLKLLKRHPKAPYYPERD